MLPRPTGGLINQFDRKLFSHLIALDYNSPKFATISIDKITRFFSMTTFESTGEPFKHPEVVNCMAFPEEIDCDDNFVQFLKKKGVQTNTPAYILTSSNLQINHYTGPSIQDVRFHRRLFYANSHDQTRQIASRVLSWCRNNLSSPPLQPIRLRRLATPCTALPN
ncbi:uncharacterized protein EDB91DRAFT_1164309 [Suillus paluster]|uniref:uncharacterized protein n=1 Tax=Suillus paluster TaxID=48578 RepID=UPI001B8736C4|nr:uncharacterized protein EDB91DRAFT_1164309 [Suillus paluster]KAG1727273.1 hypothetical protein EDB91DRAFT_1164309 [Suillus paluster]